MCSTYLCVLLLSCALLRLFVIKLLHYKQETEVSIGAYCTREETYESLGIPVHGPVMHTSLQIWTSQPGIEPYNITHDQELSCQYDALPQLGVLATPLLLLLHRNSSQ